MEYKGISKQDACLILDALDGKHPLPPSVRERLETMRLFLLRESDILASYKRNTPNIELCARWNCSQSTVSSIAKKHGL